MFYTLNFTIANNYVNEEYMNANNENIEVPLSYDENLEDTTNSIIE